MINQRSIAGLVLAILATSCATKSFWDERETFEAYLVAARYGEAINYAKEVGGSTDERHRRKWRRRWAKLVDDHLKKLLLLEWYIDAEHLIRLGLENNPPRHHKSDWQKKLIIVEAKAAKERKKLDHMKAANIRNTDKLAKGMGPDKVRKILQGPTSTSTKKGRKVWHFDLYGSAHTAKLTPYIVEFKNNKVVNFEIDSEEAERREAIKAGKVSIKKEMQGRFSREERERQEYRQKLKRMANPSK